MAIGTFEQPFRSAQVVLHDTSWRLFFHKNSSIVSEDVKLTLFGGQEKPEDNGIWYLTAIRELKERDEAGISLLPANFSKVTEDGPLEFEKGWFSAQIYSVLLSRGAADNVMNAEVFSSYDDFVERGDEFSWGTSFAQVKSLVDKVLNIWKSQS